MNEPWNESPDLPGDAEAELDAVGPSGLQGDSSIEEALAEAPDDAAAAGPAPAPPAQVRDSIAAGVAGERVEVSDSLVFGAAAGEMAVKDSLIVVATAGEIHGENVRVLMTPALALLLGAAAGVAAGLVGLALGRRSA